MEAKLWHDLLRPFRTLNVNVSTSSKRSLIVMSIDQLVKYKTKQKRHLKGAFTLEAEDDTDSDNKLKSGTFLSNIGFRSVQIGLLNISIMNQYFHYKTILLDRSYSPSRMMSSSLFPSDLRTTVDSIFLFVRSSPFICCNHMTINQN